MLPSRGTAAFASWDVYANLGQEVDLADDQMNISDVHGGFFQIRVPSAPATVAGPSVHLHWNEPAVDLISGDTSTQITVGGTQYLYDCSVIEQNPSITWPNVCGIKTMPAAWSLAPSKRSDPAALVGRVPEDGLWTVHKQHDRSPWRSTSIRWFRPTELAGLKIAHPAGLSSIVSAVQGTID